LQTVLIVKRSDQPTLLKLSRGITHVGGTDAFGVLTENVFRYGCSNSPGGGVHAGDLSMNYESKRPISRFYVGFGNVTLSHERKRTRLVGAN
jgi:hypothetical protein